MKIFYRRGGQRPVASYLAGTLLSEGERLLPRRGKGCTKAGGLGLRGGLSRDFSAQGQSSQHLPDSLGTSRKGQAMNASFFIPVNICSPFPRRGYQVVQSTGQFRGVQNPLL